ncbi:hypothetical protein BD414DRAFT_415837 [Trametes punicea]|nr:hypothetical protein BD414DRAFT_415837 [Trametes punicea]
MDSEGLASPSLSGGNTSTSFLRVISLSIALYDWILTLPAEWRFYRSQRSWRLSLGCSLFIAIRYSSIAVITLSNVGYFGSFFTPQTCARYYIAPPIFKVVQTMVSQMILGIRTINISRRSRGITWTVVSVFFLITTAQWFLNLWNRVRESSRADHLATRPSCTAGNKPPILTVWLYYLLSMVFDILTLSISTVYLIGFNPKSGKCVLPISMLTDGLVYFVALTGVNIFNLILYRKTDEATQSSGVSLGYALTWIMSQRILIHLRDAAAAHNRTITTQLVVSRTLPSRSHAAVARAVRSQFERRTGSRGGSQTSASASTSKYDRAVLSSGFDFEPDDGDVDWSWGIVSRRGEEARATQGEREREREGEGEGEGDLERAMLTVSEEEDDSEEDWDDDEPEVRVQIEETVTVKVAYDPEADAPALESYRAPRLLWDVRTGGVEVGRSGRNAGT